MFCSQCAAPIDESVRFCSSCGAAAKDVPPSATAKRPMSVLTAILITVALITCVVAMSVFAGESAASGMVRILIISTSIWAAVDSSRIRLREYRTALAAHPIVLFIGMVFLWLVAFPWYLVVRSRIKAGAIERTGKPKTGLAISWKVWAFALVLLAVGLAVILLGR